MFADAIRVGDTTIDRVMLGDTEVWSSAPSLPVVQITGALGTASRDQFRAACVEYGTTYQTVTELPFLLDTSQAVGMFRMFDGCSSLTHVPDMDTSGVANMSYMFNGCSSLTHAPDMDTGDATQMDYMFYGCSALSYVPDMGTSGVTNMFRMFNGCSSLASAPDMNTINATNMGEMFYGCSALSYVPDMDTINVTRMEVMFYGCTSLTDGNVRLIGKHPSVNTLYMIADSGLTREPFYDTDGNPI